METDIYRGFSSCGELYGIYDTELDCFVFAASGILFWNSVKNAKLAFSHSMRYRYNRVNKISRKMDDHERFQVRKFKLTPIC